MKFPLFLAATLLAVNTQVQAAEYTVNLVTASATGETMIMDPAYLKVEKGDTVKFVPADPSHNAESFSVPEGAKTFATALGETASVTLDTEGVYLYKCNPHAMMAMMGVIQVGAATNLEQAKTDWQAAKPTVMMNAERMDAYLGKVK